MAEPKRFVDRHRARQPGIGADEPLAGSIDDQIGPTVAIPVRDERHVAGMAAQHVDDRRAAVALRVEVPESVAVDAEVGSAIAVDVGEHRNVPRVPAEWVHERDRSVARGAHVPVPAAVDDEIGKAVAVDVAHERYVLRAAAEGVHIVRGAVDAPVDEPDAGVVEKEAASSGSVDVRREHVSRGHAGIRGEIGTPAGQRLEIEHHVGGTIDREMRRAAPVFRCGQRAIETACERPVAWGAVGRDAQERAFERAGEHEPLAIAKDAEIAAAVAVPVDHERLVPRRATQPGEWKCRCTGELRIPKARAIDDRVRQHRRS